MMSDDEIREDEESKEEVLRLIDLACKASVGLNDDPTDIWGRLCEIRREMEGRG